MFPARFLTADISWGRSRARNITTCLAETDPLSATLRAIISPFFLWLNRREVSLLMNIPPFAKTILLTSIRLLNLHKIRIPGIVISGMLLTAAIPFTPN